jgi:hypothetical protein
MGFGAGRAAPKPSLLVGLIAADAAAIAATPAAVILLDGRGRSPSKDELVAARTAAGEKPLGLWSAVAGAGPAKELRAAGIDFLLFDPETTPAAALLEEELGYVISLPPAPEELYLRSLESLNLEGLYVDAAPTAPTVAQQIELNRIGLLGRKPLLVRVAADASRDDLQSLRGAGAGVILTEGAPERIAALQETVLALPPRRTRREERAIVSLPRGQAAQPEADDDDDDDQDGARRDDF